MKKSINPLLINNMSLIEALVSFRPENSVFISFILSAYALITISTPNPIIHSLLEITQIVSGLVGLAISVLTFWFVVFKPKFLDKKSKSNKG